ncbi:SpoIIAA family protein [Candidatus Laterigemmans baculatus]|uniref:STAS/SEC14 domain-containing protein n=1 Tax=Candidatus Laterigemmans baculatus TaxID=2770505 RepID=UPI0013DB1578|nr:STAS/SEC14 domain-containing protein [Candidatus Laterigemmans baculatus]
MPFIVIEASEGNVIEVQVSGKLTKEAYKTFLPINEHKIETEGKVRMLVILQDFHGWEIDALWEELKFDIRHFRDIEKLAIVGDSLWERGMAAFCQPFTSATVKYFDVSDLNGARAWVAA